MKYFYLQDVTVRQWKLSNFAAKIEESSGFELRANAN